MPTFLHEIYRVFRVLVKIAFLAQQLYVFIDVCPSTRQWHDVVKMVRITKRIFATWAQAFLQSQQLCDDAL
jgi:hypothetical protein